MGKTARFDKNRLTMNAKKFARQVLKQTEVEAAVIRCKSRVCQAVIIIGLMELAHIIYHLAS